MSRPKTFETWSMYSVTALWFAVDRSQGRHGLGAKHGRVEERKESGKEGVASGRAHG